MSSVPGYTTQQIEIALSSLPTMSIVTTNANLFGPSGIYSNSNSHTLEVPGSFEYFSPSNASTSYGRWACRCTAAWDATPNTTSTPWRSSSTRATARSR